MIKVEMLRKDEEDTTVLFFESRTTDSDSLKELDELYEVIMTATRSTMVKAGYDSSNKFSVEFRNPQI